MSTNIYQIEVYGKPELYIVTGRTKEEAVIRAREVYNIQYMKRNIAKTKIVHIEKLC